MRYLVFQAALFLGIDPFTFMALSLLAGTCAFWMKEMMPNPWMAFAFYPLLLAGGVLMASLATATGIATPVEVRIDADGAFEAEWPLVFEALPAIMIMAVIGMCGAAVAIIMGVRSLARFV